MGFTKVPQWSMAPQKLSTPSIVNFSGKPWPQTIGGMQVLGQICYSIALISRIAGTLTSVSMQPLTSDFLTTVIFKF